MVLVLAIAAISAKRIPEQRHGVPWVLEPAATGRVADVRSLVKKWRRGRGLSLATVAVEGSRRAKGRQQQPLGVGPIVGAMIGTSRSGGQTLPLRSVRLWYNMMLQSSEKTPWSIACVRPNWKRRGSCT